MQCSSMSSDPATPTTENRKCEAADEKSADTSEAHTPQYPAVESFMKQHLDVSATEITLDVRSPCEYEKGHIPGSFNLPLFTDEERAQVGEFDVLTFSFISTKIAHVTTACEQERFTNRRGTESQSSKVFA